MESVQGWDEGWDETDGSSALAVGVGTPRMVGATRSGGQRPVDSTVLRRYDGSHLTLPDLSAAISPHAHQKEAVWRIVSEPTVLLDHAVRADKTGEMIVAGMEMRRLGRVRQPWICVPNHMFEQVSWDLLAWYRAARASGELRD